jgi:hypothetical protein
MPLLNIELGKKTIRVIATELPIALRLNKVAGMIAVGNIDLANPGTVEQFGRGKAVTIAPCKITTNLFGTVGKVNDKRFVHLSGLVVQSDSPQMYQGLLVHFVAYGIETSAIESYAQHEEIDRMLGASNPQLLDIVFDRSVSTSGGATIKPPSFYFRSPKENTKADDGLASELDWAIVATNLFETYPEVGIRPSEHFPNLSVGGRG